MGTKLNPAPNDCYARALPDEPTFTLLARDPQFYTLVNAWADQRELDIACGERPASDLPVVGEARQAAAEGAAWRRRNFGKWRKPA